MPSSVAELRHRADELRFFKKAYRATVGIVGFDILEESRRYQSRVDRVIYTDFEKLKDSSEVTERERRLNSLAEDLVRKTQRFLTILQYYCYLHGRLRAYNEAGDWIPGSEKKKEYVSKQIKDLVSGKSTDKLEERYSVSS